MALNESREAFRLQKEEEEKQEKLEKKQSKIRLRLIPIWLRVVIILALTVVSATAGAAVGYGVLGDGKASDIFDLSTWTHLVDLVQKEE